MAELRSVDPNSLVPNPDNPRRTPAPQAMDDQLVASIKAVGIVQPPRVKDADGQLVIIAGNRRVKAAIVAGLTTIDVLVCDADETADAMRSVSENLIRASMTSVDIWRATENLQAQGWSEQAIADALALPVRTVRRLKLLAHLPTPMLDTMAGGSMPNEEQLRTITAATAEEQVQVWKKYKPKKGQDFGWYEIARALSKRRMPFAAAKFGDDLAKAYGVVWEDDLFAPADEDGRHTTNVDGFFGAQQEWLQDSLPANGVLLTTNEYGQGELPKNAERVYTKPTRHDRIGHFLDPRSGEVRTIAYRMPEPKKPATAGKRTHNGDPAEVADETQAKTRPDVTQKGQAMIGDMRTDALHQALKEAPIEDGTLLAMLVLAFAGKNVSVQSGNHLASFNRELIAGRITDDGVVTTDHDAVRAAARAMLAAVLSCRDNMSSSGVVARIAGNAIGASLNLPNMATEEFLACLSKTAITKAATAEGVRVEARAKDTRANLVERFRDGVYVHPAALFQLTPAELEEAKQNAAQRSVAGHGWVSAADETSVGEATERGEDAPENTHDTSDVADVNPDAIAMADAD